MGLPPDLLPFAENLFRRFPEEFIALGAPNLEDIFDLRSEGTWSRRIQETPTDKTIEIKLKRRHPPHQGHPYAEPPPAHAMPTYGSGWQYPGGIHSNAPSRYPTPNGGTYGPTAPMYRAPPHGMGPTMGYPNVGPLAQKDDQTAMRLLHLENQLQELTPQVRAALISQTMQASHAPPPQATVAQAAPAQQQFPPPPISATAWLKSNQSQKDPDADIVTDSPKSPLRERRNVVPTLAIEPPVKPGAAQKVGQSSHPAVQRLESKSPVSLERRPDTKEGSPANAQKGNRPDNLNVMRVAKSSNEPESPRSPGRFSAWGKRK